MFLEPNIEASPQETGWIEVICGSMFSGKTEELIRRINRAKIARQEIMIFKPNIDNRYHSKHIVSHDANALFSMPVANAEDILAQIAGKKVDIVGVDEAQFFEYDIVDVCNEMANRGIRVIVAGLDMDYRGKPFGAMPYLMAVAEFVTKVHAICAVSGGLANYSFRKVPSDEQVLLGEQELYEARSRRHFFSELGKEESGSH